MKVINSVEFPRFRVSIELVSNVSENVRSLMMEAETVSETSEIYSLLTWMIGRKYFIVFGHRETLVIIKL
jgi:hypothetical protein